MSDSSVPAVWTAEGRALALRRPARKQLDGPAPQERDRGAGGGEFNVWYGKFPTNREQKDGAGSKTLRQDRCNSYVDAGKTRGNERGAVFFCQYFARGVCSNGPECSNLHLVPSAEDCAKHDKSPTTDIFGRSRHAEEKGNRGGVGSFFSNSRTLYIGYGAASERLGNGLQAMVARVFGEWGPLEDVYVVRGKSIAFARYVFRASAEFAKEAMGNQSLQPAWWPGQGGAGAQPEVLNVRWAYDDPNPTAIRRNKREHDEAFVDSAAREEARMPPEQRAALQLQRQLEASRAGAPAGAAALAYPDTDAQFAAAQQSAALAAWAQAAAAAGYSAAEVAAYYAAYAQLQPAAPQQAPPPPAPQQPSVVLAADAYEYDADDPYYAQLDDDEAGHEAGAAGDAAEPAAPAAAAAAPAAPPAAAPAAAPAAPPAAAPAAPPALALLASYGSDGEDA